MSDNQKMSGLRFVCFSKNVGAAANVGGPIDMEWKTFTDVVEMEAWLREPLDAYQTRQVAGVELMEDRNVR